MKKLSQNEVFANQDAIKAFMDDCEVEVANGDVTIFKAQGVYEDKTHGVSTPIPKGRITYSTNNYGGMTFAIGELDPLKQFNSFSTDFIKFRYANGILHISGKDSCGTGKGDYEIQLWA